MTITGTLTVTSSDDTRFVPGDSVTVSLDSGLDVIVNRTVEVSVPAPLPVVETPTPAVVP